MTRTDIYNASKSIFPGLPDEETFATDMTDNEKASRAYQSAVNNKDKYEEMGVTLPETVEEFQAILTTDPKKKSTNTGSNGSTQTQQSSGSKDAQFDPEEYRRRAIKAGWSNTEEYRKSDHRYKKDVPESELASILSPNKKVIYRGTREELESQIAGDVKKEVSKSSASESTAPINVAQGKPKSAEEGLGKAKIVKEVKEAKREEDRAKGLWDITDIDEMESNPEAFNDRYYKYFVEDAAKSGDALKYSSDLRSKFADQFIDEDLRQEFAIANELDGLREKMYSELNKLRSNPNANTPEFQKLIQQKASEYDQIFKAKENQLNQFRANTNKKYQERINEIDNLFKNGEAALREDALNAEKRELQRKMSLIELASNKEKLSTIQQDPEYKTIPGADSQEKLLNLLNAKLTAYQTFKNYDRGGFSSKVDSDKLDAFEQKKSKLESEIKDLMYLTSLRRYANPEDRPDFFEAAGESFLKQFAGGVLDYADNPQIHAENLEKISKETGIDFAGADKSYIEYASAPTDPYSGEWWGGMSGTSTAIMTEMLGTKRFSSAFFKNAIDGAKNFKFVSDIASKGLARYNNMSKPSRAITRTLFNSVEEGAHMQMTNELLHGGNDEELTFAAGFLGNVVAAPVNALLKGSGKLITGKAGKEAVEVGSEAVSAERAAALEALGAERDEVKNLLSEMIKPGATKDAIYMIEGTFGNKAPEAVKIIQKIGEGLIARPVGEVGQEFGEDLASIWRQSDTYQQFVDEFKKRFPDADAATQFVVASYVMGLAFGASNTIGDVFTVRAKNGFDQLSPEQQEIAKKAMDEATKDVKESEAEVISEVEIEQATREKSPEEQEWEKTANDLQTTVSEKQSRAEALSNEKKKIYDAYGITDPKTEDVSNISESDARKLQVINSKIDKAEKEKIDAEVELDLHNNKRPQPLETKSNPVTPETIFNTKKEEENAVQEKKTLSLLKISNDGKLQSNEDFVSKRSQIERGIKDEKKTNYSDQETERRLESTSSWLQAISGGDREKAENKANELLGEYLQKQEGGGDLPKNNDRRGSEISSQSDNGKISKSETGEMGTRSPQEPEYAGQSNRKSSTVDESGTFQTSYDSEAKGDEGKDVGISEVKRESVVQKTRKMFELPFSKKSSRIARDLQKMLYEATSNKEKNEIINQIKETFYESISKSSAEKILPREQGTATETGGQPQGVGQSVQGQEVTQEGGQEVSQEGVDIEQKKKEVINQPLGELPENTEDFTGVGAGYLKNNLWASKKLGKDSKTSLLGNIKNEVLNKGKKVFLYFIDPKLSEGKLDTDNKYNTKLTEKINAQGNKTLSGAENAAIENEVGAELAQEGVKAELVSDEKDGTYRIFDTKNTDLLGYIEATPELVEKLSDPNISEEEAQKILFDEAGVQMGDNVLIHANENDLSKYKTQKDVEAAAVPAGKKLFNEPNPETAQISDEYKKAKGIEEGPGSNITKLDTDRAMKIADAYDQMEDTPNDPEVQKAYQKLADETLDQFNAITDKGYTVELWEGEGEPYANSEEMIKDLKDNKHMYIFSTEQGFGDNAITDEQRKQNKLLEDSKFKDKNGKPLLYNDLFRFVHDFFGHSERGNGFGPVGEENAWDVHARMYTPLARRAMTTETRGQNSWVNFGPQMRNEDGSLKKPSDPGYLKATERRFADQKMGLLPEEFSQIEEAPVQDQEADKKSIADKIRGLKSKGGKLYSAGLGIPVAIWDGAVEIIATAVEAGDGLINGINKAKKYLQEKLKDKYNEDLVDELLDNVINQSPVQIQSKSLKGDKVKANPEGHNLSFVKPEDLIDIESLIKDIESKNEKVWFWVADQLGRGIYADKTTGNEHFLDAGPSYALDPKNRENGIVWASGMPSAKIEENIKNSDYIFIISGSPTQSKLFNKAVFKLFQDKLGDYKKFKTEVLNAKTTKGIREVLNAHSSWDTLIEDPSTDNAKLKKVGTGRKKFLIELLNAFDKPNSGLHQILKSRDALLDINSIRDGFYADNNFDVNDIMLVLKPEQLGGKSQHSTYENDILGQVIGVPDKKIDAYNILPNSLRKESDTNKALQTSRVAPYGFGIREVSATESIERETKNKAEAIRSSKLNEAVEIISDAQETGGSEVIKAQKEVAEKLGEEGAKIAEIDRNFDKLADELGFIKTCII